MIVPLKETVVTNVGRADTILVRAKSMATVCLRIPNTFDEIIPPVYNPSR